MAVSGLKFFVISLIILTSLTCIAVIVLSSMDLNYVPLIESAICLAFEVVAGVGAAFEIVPLIAVAVVYLTFSTLVRAMMFFIGTILYKMKYSPYQFSNIFLAATIIYGISVILHFMTMTSLCLIVDFKRQKDSKAMKAKASASSTSSNQTGTTLVTEKTD
ncbi:hypothetical protein QR680_018316 [Steinernema hermaphroditum]|uniref:Uncharacterized protein n=1 Tax=Steinernema hermaphroditum TaxID=289476 RepID=A0AA39HHK4_9BILA|nr:hypothetical protein QR680_018316 [Steinernema hermaphroditum]